MCVCGGGGIQTPLKNHKNIGLLINTGLDPLKNDIATKSAFNVVPSFKWCFAGGGGGGGGGLMMAHL